MKYCLVDFENITSIPVNIANEFDEVIIFVSSRTQKAKPVIQKLSGRKSQVSTQRVVGSGKNNMDFHIASYCGYLLGKFDKAKVTILSNDKGYSNTCQFWNNQQRNVNRQGVNKKSSGSNTKSTVHYPRFDEHPPVFVKVIVEQFMATKNKNYRTKSFQNLELYIERNAYPTYEHLRRFVEQLGYYIGPGHLIFKKTSEAQPDTENDSLMQVFD